VRIGNRSILPAKRMAVGALFRDVYERVLIVQPTYRPEWLIPGGAVERSESPRDAYIREVSEELGLTVVIGRLLCVDYRPADGAKSECVHFIFDGGVLYEAQIAAITLPPDELQACAWVPIEAAVHWIDVHLARRVQLAFSVLQQGQTIYAEDGVACG
jgi:8-oxo-dGTP pyrophosphatase MutT (NUDIX family)